MQRPATELIKERFSSRTYLEKPIEPSLRDPLSDFLSANRAGPFGSRARFALITASEHDRDSLKGLGTYGFIKGATGFIAGAVETGPKDLEDFGYLLEEIVLLATELGLGTCWLGGTFTKSRFADKLALTAAETMPAVVAVGHIDLTQAKEQIRRRPLSQRLPATQLFFERGFGTPIAGGAPGDGPSDAAGLRLLEAVRWAPSASNRQPWRIVRDGDSWHFYLQRRKGYGKGSLLFTVLRLADLPRVDLGIAMCHFELVAHELGLSGRWAIDEPGSEPPREGIEYIATWRSTTG
jgi:Putative TM nitroreductase